MISYIGHMMWLSYRSGEDELCGLSLCVCAQLFPTLCDPMDCSLPGCSVHGIFPGKNTGVDCHFLFQVLFLTQELNLSLQHLLHWHTDSLPLTYLGNLNSVQFSRSVMSDSLWPHGLQHARPPCPSPTPGVYSNSCPLSWWCHPTISSSVFSFSSHLQCFPASGSFPMSQFFLHIRWPKYWSFSFNISPSNEYSGLISFRMDWLDLLAVQGTPKSLPQHHSSKASILCCSVFFIVQLSHLYMATGKTIALTRWTFVGKVLYLLFNMLSRLVITFLPRSKCLLISWLQSPSAVILNPGKIKSATVSTVSPSVCPAMMGPAGS